MFNIWKARSRRSLSVCLAVVTLALGCDQPLANPLTPRPTKDQIVAVRNRSRQISRSERGEMMTPTRTVSVRETAAEALARIGNPAIPALIEALSDSDPAVRAHSARALARMGSKARDAVPALMEALNDDEQYVRICAARALGHIGPDAAPAIPALIEALREPPEEPAARGRTPRTLDDTY